MAALIAPESRTAEFDRKLGRALLWLLGVLCAVLLFSGVRRTAAAFDFITYWSSARQLVHHANPYDPQAIWAMERAAGNTRPAPFLMRNPPWILPLIAPLGLMSPQVAIVCWVSLELLLALAAIHLLRPDSDDGIPWRAYCFLPLLLCLYYGQTSVFPLFGCALFLRMRARWPAVAGIGVALMAIKPHLVLFFWPILLVESWRRRQLRPLIVGILLLLGAAGVALFFDPAVFSHYLAAMHQERIDLQFLPNVACWLRMLVAPHAVWVQGIPVLCGLVWSCAFYWRHRAAWCWPTYLPLLVAASAFLSPYSWFYDQTMFLPLLLQWRTKQLSSASRVIALCANLVPAILVLRGVPPKIPLYASFTLMWLLWWMVARRTPRDQASIAPV